MDKVFKNAVNILEVSEGSEDRNLALRRLSTCPFTSEQLNISYKLLGIYSLFSPFTKELDLTIARQWFDKCEGINIPTDPEALLHFCDEFIIEQYNAFSLSRQRFILRCLFNNFSSFLPKALEVISKFPNVNYKWEFIEEIIKAIRKFPEMTNNSLQQQIVDCFPEFVFPINFDFLYYCVLSHPIDCILRQAIHISDNFTGWTLLHKAVKKGDEEKVKLCLQYGADVNKRTHHGEIPLYFLAWCRKNRSIKQRICTLLLEAGSHQDSRPINYLFFEGERRREVGRRKESTIDVMRNAVGPNPLFIRIFPLKCHAARILIDNWTMENLEKVLPLALHEFVHLH